MKEIQHTLFGNDGEEPEEGRVPVNRKGLSFRDRMLIGWIRANGSVSSTDVPLGSKAKDLERLAMEGHLVAEGAQVRTFRINEVKREA